MSTINGLPPSQYGTSRAQNNDTGKPGTGTTGAPSAQSTAQGDTVRLSDVAQTLKTTAASLAQEPEVNSARVEAIKAALEDGSYQPDPTAIAEKMLNFDDVLSEA